MYLWRAFLDFGNLSFFRNSLTFFVCGETPCGVIVRPKKSTCLTPKWHLAIVRLRPAFLMHSKTVLMLMHSWVESFAAMPMSSMYWAHWSALIALSKYSLIKDEKADNERLRPWARRRYANVRLAKIKG